MKTPSFQLYKRRELRRRLRNLVAIEAERQYAKTHGDIPLEAEMISAIQWNEREILDYVYPTVSRPVKRKRKTA